MTVAFGSKIMAQRHMPQLENDAFSVGLIHDVGKLVLDRPVLNRKSLFDEFMAAGDKTFLSAENRILGFDHAEIGYDIVGSGRYRTRLQKRSFITIAQAPQQMTTSFLSYPWPTPSPTWLPP